MEGNKINKKLLTLAVAAYNMEQFLPRCLDSVLNVSENEWLEVIVVNDGSKDDTLAVARRYENEYPGIIKVIDKPNGHYGSCINRALEVASGKYFRPLDADDWVNTEALSSMLRELQNCRADLVVTLFSIHHKEYVQKKQYPSQIKIGKLYDAKAFDIKKNHCDLLFMMHSMTYRTELLHQMGLKLHVGIHYTDTEYIMLPLSHITNLLFLDFNVYQYNLTRDGQSSQNLVRYQSTEAFHTLALSLARHYFMHYNENNRVVRNNQCCTLRGVIFQLLVCVLIFGKYTLNETVGYLKELFNMLEQDKQLMKDVLSFRYKQIHFVWVWYYLRLRIFALIPKTWI